MKCDNMTDTKTKYDIKKYECKGYLIIWEEYGKKGNLVATYGVRFGCDQEEEMFDFIH